MEIFLNRTAQLEIDVRVAGADGKKFQPEVRLSLIKEGMRLSLPAVQVSGTNYSVSVPVLEGRLAPGTCDMEVEVLVDGKHFVPVRGMASLKEEIRPVAEIRSYRDSEADAPRVTLTASIKETRQEEQPRRQLLKKGIITKAVG